MRRVTKTARRPKAAPKDPMTEVVGILDRVVLQAQLTQFQIRTLTRRLDALERRGKATR